MVQALTGVDTDTQAEEKRRGMTIDIGFAFLSGEVTLVDVPGHDRFVKNMVRGVAGIHLGLLVVAADDGIMPQTREHVHILRYLGVPRLCVALNKIDLVEPDWVDLVEEDLRGLLDEGGYPESPVVRVSAETDVGVDQLRSTLIEVAAQTPAWDDRGFFRLPIDRVFTSKGFGTVVTGTVVSGVLEIDDTLELLPGNREVKVRGIQSHGQDVTRVALGDRAALNLANVSTEELKRGEQVATPGFVGTPKTVAVRLSLLETAPALRHNHPVRLNIGTAEVMARIKLPGRNRLKPGESAVVEFDLAAEVPAVAGDRFIVRSFSPVTTIGGGIVLDVELPPAWKQRKQWLLSWEQVPDGEQLNHLIGSAGARPLTMKALARRWGLAEKLIIGRLPEGTIRLGRSGNPWLLTPEQHQSLEERTLEVVREHHRENPYGRGANREHIRHRLGGDQRFVEQWLPDLQRRGKLEVEGDTWRLPDFSVNLNREDEQLLGRLVALLQEQGYAADYLEHLAKLLDASPEKIKTLAALAEDRQDLVRINQRMMLPTAQVTSLIAAVTEHFSTNDNLSVADFKAITGTSRKHAVPLLEYLDRRRITVRVGDVRVQPEG
ncbi:MAG: selenocysteine-specific translation elongation factor [Candidatus Neomarinimicrobiota bacterium]